MSGALSPESFREVAIYLDQLKEDISEIRTDHMEIKTELVTDIATVKTELSAAIQSVKILMEEEKKARENGRIQRNFLLISAFIAPIIVTFFVNASGIGHV